MRAVKWARLPGHGHTIAEACERFAITAHAYRKACRELGDQARLCSDDEIILAGLHPSGPVRLDALTYYYDWVNHAGISREQLLAILERLMGQGLVRRAGDGFELVGEWP